MRIDRRGPKRHLRSMTGQREVKPATSARRVARAAAKAALGPACALRTLQFDEPITHPEAARAVLVGLARRARDRLAGAARSRG